MVDGEKKNNNNKVEVLETLPPGRGRPVAGLQPVSRQRTETFLPSEKQQCGNTRTIMHIFTTALMAVSHLSDPVKPGKVSRFHVMSLFGKKLWGGLSNPS